MPARDPASPPARRRARPAVAVVLPAAAALLPGTPSGDVEATSDEEAMKVLRRFRLVFNAVKAHFREVEREAGIGGAQLWALSVVKASPGIAVTALARAMDVHQSTASNLVKGLLALGLVETHRSSADRRAALLKATAAGTRLLRKAPGPFSGVLPEALRQLDRATLQRLDADLGTLLAVLQTDHKAAKTPLAQM
jgi:MarR family transcriptional regulator, organic hydroperoxide resistance regulator